MLNSSEIFDEISAYLSDTISSEERKKIEEKINTNVSYKDVYNHLKLVAHSSRYKQINEKISLLKTEELRLRELEKPKLEKGFLRKIFENPIIKYGAAASVVALMAFGWLYFLNTPDKLPSNQYAHLFSEDFETNLIHHSISRSAEVVKYNDAQLKAYNLYSAREFDIAIPQLESLCNNQKDTLACFYLGISYLGIGEDQKGLNILNQDYLKSKYPINID